MRVEWHPVDLSRDAGLIDLMALRSHGRLSGPKSTLELVNTRSGLGERFPFGVWRTKSALRTLFQGMH